MKKNQALSFISLLNLNTNRYDLIYNVTYIK